MKILWITEFFPASDAGEITGGVEARCFFVSKYLRKLGVDLEIISRPTGGEIWYHASFASIPNRILFTIRSIIEGLKYDFDLVEGSNSATYPAAWLLGFIKRKPVVFWYPDVFQGTWVSKVGLVGIFGDISDWILFKLPNIHYLAISQSTKQKLITKGIKTNKITVTYCGIEPAEIAAIKDTTKKYSIAVVSRLVSYKHVDQLIKAVSILAKTDRKISVAIIGQGPEEQKLKQLTLELGINRHIQFLGFIKNHAEVLKTIKESRVFCHPSTVEGFGIAIVESIALGTPYVAANIPVVNEVTKDGTGGLLFTAGDVTDLASKLRLLLADDRLYQQKVRQTQKLTNTYNWEIIASGTKHLYKKLIQNKAIA